MFTTDRYVQEAITAIKSGNRKQGYELLAKVIHADPHSRHAESAWLWMSKLVEDRGQKRECLEEVLKINPYNEEAKRELSRLRSRSGGRLGDDLKTTLGLLFEPLPARIILAVGVIVLMMSCAACYFTGTLWTWVPILTPATPTTRPRVLPPTWTPLSPSSSSQGGPSSSVKNYPERTNEIGEGWVIAHESRWLPPDELVDDSGRIQHELFITAPGVVVSDPSPPEILLPVWLKYDTFSAILGDFNTHQSELV